MPANPHYECIECGEPLTGSLGSCPKCKGLVCVRYDLAATDRGSVERRASSMWRYAEALPEVAAVTLGEGCTPLVPSRISKGVFIKDEGRNPTGSLHARGASVALSVARAKGMRQFTMASSRDRAAALSAYCAAAGIELNLSLPPDAPISLRLECETYGAKLSATSSGHEPCGLEPWCLEGTKTIGYEIAEQLGWRLPDALVWPGDDEGLLALWKAFDEMDRLGWIEGVWPKMFVPRRSSISRAAAKIVEASGGACVSIADAECVGAMRSWASEEGIFAAAEGAASLAVWRAATSKGIVAPESTVVLVNTISGYRQSHHSWMARPKSRNIGGIIQPY